MIPRFQVTIEWFDAFAAGIYLLFGLIHLDLWLKRRDRASHFWLAGASVGALLVDLTGMRLRGVAPGVLGALPTLNLLGVAIVTASLFELVLSLGDQRSGRLTRTVYLALFVFALLIGFGGLSQLMAFFMLTCAVLLLSAMVHAARSGRAGDRESRAIAAGLVVLIVCLVMDILMLTHVIPRLPGVPIVGFTTLFLVSARALNSRYEREHRELVALRNDLEQRVSDRTRELEDANQRLAEASRTDSLTGLPNRRGFLDMGNIELQRSADCSVVMVDLDHFKEINDRHGHAGGDVLLKEAASCLRRVLRAEDLVARWGGEEFILLLPNTNTGAAVTMAEKARAALAASAFERNGTIETITASFGIAQHRQDRSLEATIAAADEALYRAKEGGRNRIEA